MLRTTSPAGSRGSRSNTSSRGPSRGGIQKKSSAPVRTDKDGDLVMDAASGGRGRGRGTAAPRIRPSSTPFPGGHSSTRSRPGRALNPSAIQTAIIRGMSSGDAIVRAKSRLATSDIRGDRNRKDLAEMSIRGWDKSKAASNPGGGSAELIKFIERKATPPKPKPSDIVRIRKSHIDGDALLIFISPEHVSNVIRLDKFTFAGAPLEVKVVESKESKEISNEASELKQKITAMLSRRYNPELKLLDLSALAQDPEFANSGMFATHSRGSKFFPAIMAVCDSLFSTAEQKREAVISVTLANNSLPNVTTVTSLAQTFPELKNLDLSNNQFKDLGALEAWRRKFRSLDHLVLAGNELVSVTSYKEDIMKWFPTLRILDNIQVRSDEEVVLASKSRHPIPVLPASFRDEAAIGENFVKQFFPAYDMDRNALAGAYYDAESTFTMSVNVSAPRANDTPVATWESYIKKSRNLTKITTLPARMSRLFKGVEKIRELWLTLPSSRHPDLLAESPKWCIECHSLSSLPDPTGASPAGVGGLLIMVHGEFGEVDVSTGQVTTTRSFDRTFVLGPGGGIGGVRVISDALVVRAYGGYEVWKPTAEVTQLASHQRTPSFTRQVPEAYGEAVPGKSEEQLQKELLVIQLCQATRMVPQYAEMCLEQTGWNLESAAKAFEEVKANLPGDAWF